LAQEAERGELHLDVNHTTITCAIVSPGGQVWHADNPDCGFGALHHVLERVTDEGSAHDATWQGVGDDEMRICGARRVDDLLSDREPGADSRKRREVVLV
jgi:hypothetical protein